MIYGMFDSGALPSAMRLVQFTSRRHGVLSDNIANLSTPYFKPHDLDSDGFQNVLAEAIDRRRSTVNPTRGPLPVRDSRQLEFAPDGINVRAEETHRNILFHDENNRDLERLMQDLAENTMAHQLGIEVTRNQFDMLNLAIRERL